MADEISRENWWADILSCPFCHDRMSTYTECAAGHKFDAEDGTPRLIPSEMDIEVRFAYNSARSFMSDEELLEVLEDPVRPEVGDLPYHLDLAHAQCLQELPKGTRVLEIGCGGGQSRPWFQNKGMKYIGTDVSKTRVWEELRLFGGPDLLCDAHFLPFEDESFDVVYSAAVFEHLACPVRAVQEVRRVLKPGGLMLGNASFMEPWHDHSYFHLSPLGAVELLTAGEMRPLKVWPSRNYSGFKALAAMRCNKFNPIGLLGPLMHYGQELEDSLKAATKKLLGKKEKSKILLKASSAGAIDWIAIK